MPVENTDAGYGVGFDAAGLPGRRIANAASTMKIRLNVHGVLPKGMGGYRNSAERISIA